MFAFGLFTQVSDSGPQGPLVLWGTGVGVQERDVKVSTLNPLKEQLLSTSPSHRSMHQYLDMMAMELTTSTSKSRKSPKKDVLVILKLTGETFVDPTAMSRQIRKSLGLLKFATFNRA